MKSKYSHTHGSSGRLMEKFQQHKINTLSNKKNHSHHRHAAKKSKNNRQSQINTSSYSSSHLTQSALFMMAFAWQMKNSFAETCYALDTQDAIHYLIEHAKNNFPHFEKLLTESCKTVLLFDSPQANYTRIDSPHCVRDADDPEPGLSLAIAIGKNMSSSFSHCVNEAMLKACEAFYAEYDKNKHASDPSTLTAMLIIISTIIGLGCCAGLLSYCYATRCNNTPTLNQNTAHIQERRPLAINNGGYASYGFYPVSTHHDSSHHHHDDSSHHHNNSSGHNDVRVHWGADHHH